jgi:hypothetical protein
MRVALLQTYPSGTDGSYPQTSRSISGHKLRMHYCVIRKPGSAMHAHGLRLQQNIKHNINGFHQKKHHNNMKYNLQLTFQYGLTIFLSAFLLFQVQPLIGKMILP